MSYFAQKTDQHRQQGHALNIGTVSLTRLPFLSPVVVAMDLTIILFVFIFLVKRGKNEDYCPIISDIPVIVPSPVLNF